MLYTTLSQHRQTACTTLPLMRKPRSHSGGIVMWFLHLRGIVILVDVRDRLHSHLLASKSVIISFGAANTRQARPRSGDPTIPRQVLTPTDRTLEQVIRHITDRRQPVDVHPSVCLDSARVWTPGARSPYSPVAPPSSVASTRVTPHIRSSSMMSSGDWPDRSSVRPSGRSNLHVSSPKKIVAFICLASMSLWPPQALRGGPQAAGSCFRWSAGWIGIEGRERSRSGPRIPAAVKKGCVGSGRAENGWSTVESLRLSHCLSCTPTTLFGSSTALPGLPHMPLVLLPTVLGHGLAQVLGIDHPDQGPQGPLEQLEHVWIPLLCAPRGSH